MTKPPSQLPPLPSIAVLLVASALSLWTFPTLHELDVVATIETFTTPALRAGCSSWTPSVDLIGRIRLSLGLSIFSLSAYRIFLSEGATVKSTYLPESKLKPATFRLTGFKGQCSFTFWCWNLLGTSFLLSGYATTVAVRGNEVNPWVLRLALLTFEASAPLAFLVSAVVRYALWPNALKHGPEGTAIFRFWVARVVHNANVLAVLIEVCLLGQIPVIPAHFSLAIMFGVAYAIFAWSFARWWSPKDGPHYFYFFLDPTIGVKGTYALLALMAVLVFCYGVFCLVDGILEHLGGGIVTHLLGMAVCLSAVCRFRD
mmetsp:Transcript_58739/g.174780  ORF Transcript_58739/g.174780 Transcript_58739/m.174780 type:complete len:315 (-) Transcript_58739:202-1146(-)